MEARAATEARAAAEIRQLDDEGRAHHLGP